MTKLSIIYHLAKDAVKAISNKITPGETKMVYPPSRAAALPVVGPEFEIKPVIEDEVDDIDECMDGGYAKQSRSVKPKKTAKKKKKT